MGFMTTGDVVVPEHDGDEDQAAVVVADDDDPDEPPAPLPLGAFRPAIAGDSDGDEADTDVPHGPPPLPPPAAPDAVVAVDGMVHPAGLVELCDEDCRLLRDFLETALPSYGYISVPAYFDVGAVEADEDTLLVFQVLRKSTKAVTVQTFEDAVKPKTHYQITVLPLEVWNPQESSGTGGISGRVRGGRPH